MIINQLFRWYRVLYCLLWTIWSPKFDTKTIMTKYLEKHFSSSFALVRKFPLLWRLVWLRRLWIAVLSSCPLVPERNYHFIKTYWMFLSSPDSRVEHYNKIKTLKAIKCIAYSDRKRRIRNRYIDGQLWFYHWLKGIYIHYMWLHLICHSVMLSM